MSCKSYPLHLMRERTQHEQQICGKKTVSFNVTLVKISDANFIQKNTIITLVKRIRSHCHNERKKICKVRFNTDRPMMDTPGKN